MTYRLRTNSAGVESFVAELAETSERGESPHFHTSRTQLGGLTNVSLQLRGLASFVPTFRTSFPLLNREETVKWLSSSRQEVAQWPTPRLV